MQRPLPPLNALRAFDAAARHLSLTRAAEELRVTPGALSHQIRGLEDMLGVALFHRQPRAITLTEAGRRLHPGLQAGFDQIRQAVAELQPRTDDRILVVSTAPGFTAKWLVPRLYRFVQAHPEIDARVSSGLAHANFHADGVDVAIRNQLIGVESDPDLLVEWLIDLTVLPVCSPRLLEKVGEIRTPADMAHVPLIHDDMLAGVPGVPTWPDWLTTHGMTPGTSGVDVSRGLRLNSADHALEAAVEGAGITLSYTILAHDDLRSGRLVAPFGDDVLPTRRAFHFVCPRSYERRAHVRAFRDWIKEELAQMQLPSPRRRAAP